MNPLSPFGPFGPFGALGKYGNRKLKAVLVAALAAIVVIAAAVFGFGLGASSTASTSPISAPPSASTTAFTATTTTNHANNLLANLMSITNASALFGADYTITFAGAAAGNSTMEVSMQRYLNDSRLELTVRSRSPVSEYTDLYVKNGSAYYACSANSTVSRCFSINASAVQRAPSFRGNLDNGTGGLNFSGVSYTTSSFNGHRCSLESGTIVPGPGATSPGGTIAACVSNSTGIVYNFTITSQNSSMSGSLTALFEPSLPSALIGLPNYTLSQYGAQLSIQALPVFVINNFNPLFVQDLRFPVSSTNP